MVRILHGADFHLDSAFGALSSQQARERRQEARALLTRLAQKANEDGVDVVLLSGDLFDGAALYQETAEELVRALGEIHARVFISPGNHDCCSSGSAYEAIKWPDNVTIFKNSMIESVELPELNCTVYGAAFTRPEQHESLLRGFRAAEDGRIHLMVLHGEVISGESKYDPITKEDIARSGLHYLALGHVHQYSGVQKAGETYYAYPGCPEGRGFDELGEKGVLCGTVDENGVDLRFVPMARRRYEILSVDVTGREVVEAINEALEGDTKDHIYRIILTGEVDKGISAERLQETLSDRFYYLEIQDRTRISEDIWSRAGEDSLRGMFLRELQQKKEEAQTEEEREQVEMAVRFGLAALDRRDW